MDVSLRKDQIRFFLSSRLQLILEACYRGMKPFLGGNDFSTWSIAIEGVQIFGSTKRKLNLFLVLKLYSYHCNKINYSISKSITQSTKAYIEEFLKLVNYGIDYSTFFLESKVNFCICILLAYLLSLENNTRWCKLSLIS